MPRRVHLNGLPTGITNPYPNLRRFRSTGVGVLEKREIWNGTLFHSLLEFDTYICMRFRYPEAKAHTQMLLDPPDELREIARALGVDEPRFSKRVPSLSTDVVLETRDGVIPIACKTRKQLAEEPRQTELLAITDGFWGRRNCTQLLVTEDDLDEIECKNLRQAYHAYIAAARWPSTVLAYAVEALFVEIAGSGASTVEALTARLDLMLPPPFGRAATIFWAAIWHHWIPVRVSNRILPSSFVAEVIAAR